MWLKGRSSADYFAVTCTNCGGRVRMEYLGWDPSVPHFKATCSKCGQTGNFKLSGWKGLPPKADTS